MKTCLTVLATVLLPACLFAAPPEKLPPKIIIKADDLKTGGSDRVFQQWQRFADFLKERKIKAGIGIICDSLEGDKPKVFHWIKDLQGSGLVEFWLHAYDHKAWVSPDGVQHNEFADRTFDEQLERFAHCQQLAKEKLGFQFHTFGPPGTGAPGPGTDANTIKAMAAEPNMKVWLYNCPIDEPGQKLDAEGKVAVLDRVWQVNIEHPLFKPSLEEFQKGYAKYADKRDYFVIQGHPQHWSEEGFAEFVKIVDFLTAQGAVFVTPSEYAAQRGSSKPAATAAVPPTKP